MFSSRLSRPPLVRSKLIYSGGGGVVVTDTGTTHNLLLETGDAVLLETSDRLLLESSPVKSLVLIHADGVDGSASFTDSSPNAYSITANGGAQIDTAQSKFGGSSALMAGDGSYLGIASSA